MTRHERRRSRPCRPLPSILLTVTDVIDIIDRGPPSTNGGGPDPAHTIQSVINFSVNGLTLARFSFLGRDENPYRRDRTPSFSVPDHSHRRKLDGVPRA